MIFNISTWFRVARESYVWKQCERCPRYNEFSRKISWLYIYIYIYIFSKGRGSSKAGLQFSFSIFGSLLLVSQGLTRFLIALVLNSASSRVHLGTPAPKYIQSKRRLSRRARPRPGLVDLSRISLQIYRELRKRWKLVCHELSQVHRRFVYPRNTSSPLIYQEGKARKRNGRWDHEFRTTHDTILRCIEYTKCLSRFAQNLVRDTLFHTE